MHRMALREQKRQGRDRTRHRSHGLTEWENATRTERRRLGNRSRREESRRAKDRTVGVAQNINAHTGRIRAKSQVLLRGVSANS
jgi:hypothetical protein